MLTAQAVSQMMNNQNAQFANQAAYASNLSSSIGIGVPPMQTLGFNYGNLHDPYGTQSAADFGQGLGGAAGGMLQNLPGIAGGMAMGAGMLSMVGIGGGMMSALGGMDPMTRAMAGAARRAKQFAGFSQNTGFFSALGQAATKGSLGRFALGAAAGAAVPLGIAYAGAQVLGHIGQNITAGAQEEGAIHASLRQNFDFHNPSARSGRGFNRFQRDQIADTLRGISEADPFTSMGELSRVMAQAAKGNLLQGTTTAKEFGDKFRKLTETLKETAKIMGTSLEGAMSFFDASKSMGFYNKIDIVRNAQNARIMAGGGLTSRGIMQEQAMGAAQARSMGYSGAQGAILARRSVQGARDMFMAGGVSEEDLGEMTGGLRGEEAYKTLGRQMQQASYSLAQSGIGRAIYAALAEKKGEGSDARFTGRLDANLLKQFRAGSLSSSDIRQLASSKLASAGTDTKISFLNMEKDIAGSFAAGAGAEGWMGVINMVRSQRPHLSDEKVKLLLKNMTGMGRRQIEYIMKMYEKQDEINQQNAERAINGLRRQMEEATIKQNHTFEGIMRQVTHSAAQYTTTPLKRAGANLSRWGREVGRSITSALFGRTRTAQLHGDILSTIQSSMAGGEHGRLADARMAGASEAAGGMSGALNMTTGLVPRLLGTGGLQRALADMYGFSDYALSSNRDGAATTTLDILKRSQGVTADASDDVSMTRAGMGALFNDKYSQKRLSLIQRTLADASTRSDSFFKDHKDALASVRAATQGLTAKQLFQLRDTAGSSMGGQSQYAARRDALAAMISSSPRGSSFKNLTGIFARELAKRDGRDFDKLSSGEKTSLETLAQQSILQHATVEGDVVRMFWGSSEYSGMIDGNTVMSGMRLAQARDAQEAEVARLYGAKTMQIGDGDAGLMIGLADALTGGVLGLSQKIYGKGGDPAAMTRLLKAEGGQRADVIKALSGSEQDRTSMMKKYGKDDQGDMMQFLRRVSDMSKEDRLALSKQLGKAESLRMAEGQNVFAGQMNTLGRELSGISSAALETEVGGGIGGVVKELSQALSGMTAKQGFSESGQKIMALHTDLARALGGMDRQKLAKAREMLGGTGAGRAALVNAKLFSRRVEGSLTAGLTQDDDEQFIKRLSSLGYGNLSDEQRRSVLSARGTQNVENVQKALMATSIGKKEDALQVLTLMKGGIEKMASVSEKLLDVMLTVHAGGNDKNATLKQMASKWQDRKGAGDDAGWWKAPTPAAHAKAATK